MILNLTQHVATEEQVASGVVDLVFGDREYLKSELTFDVLPTEDEIVARAAKIAALAERYAPRGAMIGGAPYLMGPLERELQRRGIEPLYSFTRRESVEEALPDGSVRVVKVFRHAGFVPAVRPE